MLTKKAPVSALLIADFFIRKGIESRNPVNPMKLQKLIYFAHGFHLALYNNTPLIKEEICAWKYGPVIASVYEQYKHYGNRPIDSIKFRKLNLEPNLVEFLEFIWSSYSEYSAIRLSNLTHVENSPWDIALSPYEGIIPRDVVISNSTINNYFKRVWLKQAQ